jgi:hypothetical protein
VDYWFLFRDLAGRTYSITSGATLGTTPVQPTADQWTATLSLPTLMPPYQANDPGVTTSGQHMIYDLLPTHGSWAAPVRMPNPGDWIIDQ